MIIIAKPNDSITTLDDGFPDIKVYESIEDGIDSIIRVIKCGGDREKALKLAATNAQLAYKVSTEVLYNRFVDGEDIIATNPNYSYMYAKAQVAHIPNFPFKKGERAISKVAELSRLYARDVIREPFPLGEYTISQDPKESYMYALEILKGPFRLGEIAISQVPYYSYVYARDVLKGRFLLGEPSIATDGDLSSNYAQNVMFKRFPLGEFAISRNPEAAFRYAGRILNSRFRMAERIIFNSGYRESYYARHFSDAHTE